MVSVLVVFGPRWSLVFFLLPCFVLNLTLILYSFPPMQSFVVAIVIPDQEVLEPWAKSKKIPGDFGELCDNEVRLLHLIKKSCIV